MKIGERKGVTPAIVVLILALVAVGLVVVGFPNLTGHVAFAGGEYENPIIITSPEDGATYASVDDVTEITWEFAGGIEVEALDSCWYSLDGGENNVTVDCALDNIISLLTAVEGENTWKVYANDSDGNETSANVTFSIGEPEPEMFAGDVPEDEVVTITYPVDGEEYEVPPQVLEYTLHENIDVANDLVSCEYNDGITITKEKFSCIAPISILSKEGSNVWTVYLNDKFGNEVEESVSFTYTPDTSAPYSWVVSGGDGSRDRFGSKVLVKQSEDHDNYLIQPSLYGKIKKGTDGDYIITSKGYAYVTTDTNKVLKISINSGLVDGTLEGYKVLPKMLINSGRDLLYALRNDGKEMYVIDANNMELINKSGAIGKPTSLTQSFVLKNDKIFLPGRTSSEGLLIYDIKDIYATEFNSNVLLKSKGANQMISSDITDVIGTDYIAMMTVKNSANPGGRLYLVNATSLEVVLNVTANCTTPISEVVSRGTTLYYMCDNGGKGVIVELDVSDLNNVKQKIYGSATLDRLKNSYKTTFAVGNEWLYYGTSDGITAVLLSNLGAVDVAGNPLREPVGEVTSIAVSKDTVYATTKVGELIALNASNINNKFWKTTLGLPGTQLYNTIFSTSSSLLVLGSNNELYSFPKGGVEIEFAAAELGKEWISQGGQQTRTRYINTTGAATSSFKRIAINPNLYGFIKIDNEFDTVLTYGQYAYVLRNDKKINKISLSTGKVEAQSTAAVNHMMIDTSTENMYAISTGSAVLKLSLEDLSIIKAIRTRPKNDPNEIKTCEVFYKLYISDRKSILNEPIISQGRLIAPSYDKRKKCKAGGSCDKAYRLNLLTWELRTFETRPVRISILPFPVNDFNKCERKRTNLNHIKNNKNGVVLDDGTVLYLSGENRIGIVDPELNIAVKYAKAFTDCKVLSSELVFWKDSVYFICDDEKLKSYKLDTPEDSDSPVINLPLAGNKLSTENAFAIKNGKGYYGTNDGKLVVLNLVNAPSIQKVALTDFDGNITSVAAVEDMLYAGTDTGWVYALDYEKLENTDASDDIIWSVKATTERESQEISSIIIPGDGSMLAVGGTNSLFLFGDVINSMPEAYCGSGPCDEGETCETCPEDCGTCDTYNEESGDEEDDTRSDYPKTNCRRNIDGESLWRDTGEDSEDDCNRDEETCCPWGQVCKEFDTGWKCIFDGVTTGCSSYTTLETCADFYLFSAFESVEIAQGPGFCGSFADTGAYYDCMCVWDTETNSCQPGWELVDIQPDGTRDVQESCQLTCDDGECIGGIKTVTCSAIGTPEGVCSGTETQAGCAIPTEVPFFTLMNALVAVGILAGFYILTRK